ncbi:MAG TPA: response regulator [Myxococcales bacterium]|nr:response regulator [Myxococcales bacterium]
MPPDPYRYFRVEARELVDQLGRATLELEQQGAGVEVVQRLLRFAHTLKGAARVVKQREIADEAHAIEELVVPYREAGGQVERTVVDGLLRLLDGIGERLGLLGAPAPVVAAPGGSLLDESVPTLHADAAEVDSLLDGLAAAHVQLGALRRAAAVAERVQQLGALLVEQLAPRRQRGAAPPVREKASAMADDMRELAGGLGRAVGEAIERMDRELRQVRDAAEQLRLVSAGTLFTPLERLARDAAGSLSKQVTFEGLGGDVRLDAHVLAGARAALVQLVRNAVAHGIESAAERRAAGKGPAGRVSVEIARRGNRVAFRCRDDGRGIDLEALRRAAVRRGFAAAETAALAPEALIEVLLRGGITTSPAVTQVSGRGVGLDVVRDAVEKLGGEIAVRTEAGRGTVFELTVPLTLAAIDGLAVDGGGVVATLPLDAVKRAVWVGPGAIARTPEGESLLFEGKVIPFLRLATALRAAPPEGRSAGAGVASAVVIESGGRLAALGVDRLLGASRVVLSPLPALAPADPIAAGASFDADGNPRIVLEPEQIVEKAGRVGRGASAAAPAPRNILVVDDSLTTRMLEQSILQSAGYAVDVAASAEEALERAHARRYALFLVDVEMPGMDGFTFIERVRADPLLSPIPAILVTSRSAPEDRERGDRVGAQGYIVKSEFDQQDLLARIGRLTG